MISFFSFVSFFFCHSFGENSNDRKKCPRASRSVADFDVIKI